MKTLLALVLGFVLSGCSSSTPSGGDRTTTTQTQYTCSMCGGTYDRPGKCSHCGMALVEKR